MALSILDGNQSATTLSTILSSGQHITAHTVISLGTQAITDIVNATSANLTNTQLRASAVTVGGTVTVGNSLTISSLPAISGTVTASLSAGTAEIGTVKPAKTQNGFASFLAVDVFSGKLFTSTLLTDGTAQIGSVTASISGTVPISISSVTVGNSVTISSLPAISGTVTANLGTFQVKNYNNVITSGYFRQAYDDSLAVSGMGDDGAVLSQIISVFGVNLSQATGSLPISGTVTIGSALPAGTNSIGVVTIGAGTVTIGAGTAQIGSVTASISGTVPISISSVTIGNSLTIGSLPAISGTVTANTFALQGTAVTTSNFTSTTASTVLANYNATREVLTIFNEGAGNLHIAPGATCTTIAYQVRLSAGDYFEVPSHQTTITHSAVYATAGTARICQLS